MKREDNIYQIYVQILKEELVTAMGCTEPIAISYAAARARAVLGELPEKIVVKASGSIIKNVKSVVVPNTGGLRGIEAAAAAGVVCGNENKKLEVLSEIESENIERIKGYLGQAYAPRSIIATVAISPYFKAVSESFKSLSSIFSYANLLLVKSIKIRFLSRIKFIKPISSLH